MTTSRPLGSLVDPHCGRSSQASLCFVVGHDEWEVVWGPFDAFGTASYWVNQTVRGRYSDKVAAIAGGADLVSETIYCLLGGFGVTAESARAAYRAVRALLADKPSPSAEEVEAVLRRRSPVGSGGYRFPRQRAARVADAVAQLRADAPPQDPVQLRNYLLGLKRRRPEDRSLDCP